MLSGLLSEWSPRPLIHGGNKMVHLFRSSADERSAPQPFNGIRAIQTHLDQRNRIENYVNGGSRAKIDLSLCCHAGCPLGKWLHSEDGILIKDAGLSDSLSRCCKNCEEFRHAAADAVLFADMGESELAKAALEAGQLFNDASTAFQQNLADLHATIQGL